MFCSLYVLDIFIFILFLHLTVVNKGALLHFNYATVVVLGMMGASREDACVKSCMESPIWIISAKSLTNITRTGPLFLCPLYIYIHFVTLCSYLLPCVTFPSEHHCALWTCLYLDFQPLKGPVAPKPLPLCIRQLPWVS